MKSLLSSYYNRLSMKADQVVCNTNKVTQRELGFARNSLKRMSLHETSANNVRVETVEKSRRWDETEEPVVDHHHRHHELPCETQPTGYDFASSIKFIDDNDSTDLSNTSGEDLLNEPDEPLVNTNASFGMNFAESSARRHDLSATCKCEKRPSPRVDRSFYKDQLESYDNILKALEKINEDVLSYFIDLPESNQPRIINTRSSSSSTNNIKNAPGADENRKSHLKHYHSSSSSTTNSELGADSVGRSHHRSSTLAKNSTRSTGEIKSWLFLIRKLIIESREQFKMSLSEESNLTTPTTTTTTTIAATRSPTMDMNAFRPDSILDDETEALKRLNETLSNENCQLKDKINDLEAKLKLEIKSSNEKQKLVETIETLKCDRKKLRCEKFDLLNQTKELYEIIESKENEIRDFLRHYELKTKETSSAVKKLIESKAKIEKERDELKAQVGQLIEEKNQRVEIIEDKDATISKLQKQLYEIKTKSIRHSFGKDSDYGYASSKSRDTLSSSINESKSNSVEGDCQEKTTTTTATKAASSSAPSTKYTKSKKEERMLKSKSSYDHKAPANDVTLERDEKLSSAKKSHSLFVKNSSDKIVKSKSTSNDSRNATAAAASSEISCIMNKSFMRENPFEFDDLNEVLDSEEFVDLDIDEVKPQQPAKPTVSVLVSVVDKKPAKSASSGTKRKSIRQSMSSDCIVDKLDDASADTGDDDSSTNFISLNAQVNKPDSNEKKLADGRHPKQFLYNSSTMSFEKSSHSSASSTSGSSTSACVTGDAIGSSISPSVSVTSTSSHNNLLLSKSSENDLNTETSGTNASSSESGAKYSSMLNSSSNSSSSSTASPVLMNQSLTICEDDEARNKSSNELMYSHYVPSHAAKTPKHSLSVSMNVQSTTTTTTTTNNSRSSKILNSIIKISSAASATSQKVFSSGQTPHSIVHTASLSTAKARHQANSTFSTLSSSSKSSYLESESADYANKTISYATPAALEATNSLFYHHQHNKRPQSSVHATVVDEHFHQQHIAGSCVGLGCLKMIGDLKNSSSLLEYNVAATTTARSPCLLTNTTSISEIGPEAWTSANIKVWLERLGFHSNQIKSSLKYLRSGKDLLSLNESDFDRVFLINAGLLHKRKLRLAIEELKSPEKCKYPKMAEIGPEWVCKVWLNEIGLVQYMDAFKANLVDGRLLNSLQKKDLEKYLNISKRHHQTSILLAIDLLRRHEFDIEKLERQRAISSSSNEFNQMEIQYWKNENFVEWLELVNLQAGLDVLSSSGLHGALVADSCFNADFLYGLLGVNEESSRYVNMKKILEDEIKLLRKSKSAGAGSKNDSSVFLRPLTSFKTDKRIFTFRGSLGRALGRKVKRDISSPLIDDQTYKRIEYSHKIVDMKELKSGLAL